MRFGCQIEEAEKEGKDHCRFQHRNHCSTVGRHQEKKETGFQRRNRPTLFNGAITNGPRDDIPNRFERSPETLSGIIGEGPLSVQSQSIETGKGSF